MNKILFKSAKNFAASLGLDIIECKDEKIRGYVAEVDIEGDLNYQIFVVVPKEKLELISEILFGDKNDYEIEDMTKEIANLIVGNAKVIASERDINFNISLPQFLGEYNNNIDYDEKLCLKTNGINFFVLYKERK